MTSVQNLHSDALITISRQEAHLQITLQHLLDAQSEGLLAGLTGGPPQAETSSTGSRTPTVAYSSPGGPRKQRSIVPVRQPAKRKLGLKGARRGIARAMSDLANLKIEEGRILEEELIQRAKVLGAVQRLEAKTVGLKKHIDEIESEDTTRKVEDLRGEEKALDYEIRELETKLWDMKAKHRHLLRKIEGMENGVQSKLSSYQSALLLAEKESRSFLERPPIQGNRTATNAGLWALPAERRTLQMARDQYTEEQDVLRKRLDDVETERGALEDGSSVWNEVVEEVDRVERLLREEMQGMGAPLVQENGDGNAIRGMRKILEHMSKAKSRIERKLEVSEARDWKLLVCCIGAELEAMIEGRSVLQDALETAQRAEGGEYVNEDDNAPVTGTNEVSPVELSARLEELGDQDPVEPRGIVDKSEDEDDGPGPDLLISSDDL
ncbi:hypothetical protein IMSHALPRED_008025 [Imshaugia aleurites]|uniref:Atg28p n=1 Tax=Imshaugia aleurites TaxID=172621 RepID=A0A8H3ISD8_9LECA|nr:hypothetical protein IMSHALPRED_008025 [Imshaugia aleurites]